MLCATMWFEHGSTFFRNSVAPLFQSVYWARMCVYVFWIFFVVAQKLCDRKSMVRLKSKSVESTNASPLLHDEKRTTSTAKFRLCYVCVRCDFLLVSSSMKSVGGNHKTPRMLCLGCGSALTYSRANPFWEKHARQVCVFVCALTAQNT